MITPVRNFHTEHIVRGRRDYECVHCRQAISQGEQHVHVAGCSCGGFYAHRAHLACHAEATGRAPAVSDAVI